MSSLEPIRERRAYYEEHQRLLSRLLRKGTELANSEAEKTLDKMKKAMQIGLLQSVEREDYNLAFSLQKKPENHHLRQD